MSTRPSRHTLDADRVTAAAVALADEHGLEAASMRGVAEALGVTPMALYKHVANHSALVDAMLDRVLTDLASPAPAADWRDAVRGLVLGARAVVQRHPWAREAMETRPLATPRVLAHMNSLMAAMFDGGLSADLVHQAMHALSTRMFGFTRDIMPTPEIPEEPAARAAAMTAYAEQYPAITRMATTAPGAGEECDADAEFAFALDLLLEGIQRRHDAGWSSLTA